MRDDGRLDLPGCARIVLLTVLAAVLVYLLADLMARLAT